jgi:hypothetical protein
MVSAQERLILDYLATSPQAWFSAREICRRAASKQAWQEDQKWAIPILRRLEARGLLLTDGSAHYRLPDSASK